MTKDFIQNNHCINVKGLGLGLFNVKGPHLSLFNVQTCKQGFFTVFTYFFIIPWLSNNFFPIPDLITKSIIV